MTQASIEAGTEPSARLIARVARAVREYLDIVAGAAGATCTVVAVTALFGWPWALLVAGIALVALSLWMPEWD